MEKKRAKGIIIFGLFAFFMCWILGKYSWGLFIFSLSGSKPVIMKGIVVSAGLRLMAQSFLILLFAISFGISGISLLALKEWARRLFIGQMITLFIVGNLRVYYIVKGWIAEPTMLVIFNYLFLTIIPFFSAIYYFSRSKVKEQFR